MGKLIYVLLDALREGDFDVVCRDGNAFTYYVSFYKGRNLSDCHMFFDNDLGCDDKGIPIISGRKLMEWMFEFLEEKSMFPPKISLVTSNPVELQTMGIILQSNGYKKLNGNNRIWELNR